MLIPPILTCIADQDSKIRYLACESLYNLAKAARGHVLRFFNEIFDSLSKVTAPHPRCSLAHPVLSPRPARPHHICFVDQLAADADTSVKSASELLDRLIKDIITEGGKVDLDRLVPLLRERIYVKNGRWFAHVSPLHIAGRARAHPSPHACSPAPFFALTQRLCGSSWSRGSRCSTACPT